MKLLLVDDEILTRKGLLENIHWSTLQIHQVIEASDGLQALALAKEHSPEIILTDICMPRMDGVVFANEIKAFLPETSIIFMSGYSDKEYLQAAIRLKAISYVEKPIDLQEVELAVLEAVKHHDLAERNKFSRHFHMQEKVSQLALTLSRPLHANYDATSALIDELELSFCESTCFLSLILKTHPTLSAGQGSPLFGVFSGLEALARAKGFALIRATRYDGMHIFFLYADKAPKQEAVADFCQVFGQELSPVCSYFIAVGKPVVGISHCFESYNHAAVLMQSSFFDEYNTVLFAKPDTRFDQAPIDEAYEKFREAVSKKDTAAATAAANALYACLQAHKAMLPSLVRDLYFKLFISMEQAYHLRLLHAVDQDEPIWDRIMTCHTLSELQGILLAKLTAIAAEAASHSPESAAVTMMKDYIRKNYDKDSLSVKDISEYVQLNVAYACTKFKNETGTTLNQYLTEYRMDKAKALLADPRIKIVDISARIGYLDSNYFGKSFKKSTGLSPSEYREKFTT